MSLGKLLGLVALLLSLYILWQIRQILLLVFSAIVLAIALNRLVRQFCRSGFSRPFAVLASVALMFVVLIGFFWLIVPPFIAQIEQLTDLVPFAVNQVQIWLNVLDERLPDWMMQSLANIDTLAQQLQPLLNEVVSQSVTVFSSSFAILLKVLLVLVLTLMLLAEPTPYRQAFLKMFPAFYRKRADEILRHCDLALGGWLVAILFNMSVVAFLSCVGLWALQVPLALAHAGLAGMLAFIPNIGPTLSVIPPLAIALMDSPWKAIAVLILYIVIQQLETNLLTPHVMVEEVSLLPAVTLTAQVTFAVFFGFLGLLLALPLTIVGQVWLEEVVVTDILDRWQQPTKSRPPRTVKRRGRRDRTKESEPLAIAKPNGSEAEHEQR